MSKRDIDKGECPGFYNGSVSATNPSDLYSVQVDSRHYISPFPDTLNISHSERDAHPFANMNEPYVGDAANCFMIIQDLLPHEVEWEGVERVCRTI